MTQNDHSDTTDEEANERPSGRDLARIGARLGDDGRLWKTATRSMASAPQEFGTEAWREHVCGQIYAEADGNDPSEVSEFVDTFLEVYELDGLADANALLGREAHARQNYEGQLGFVRAGQ